MPFKYNALLGLGLDNTIPLDGAGKIPSTYLPSYVDDVEEYNNLAAFPATGETGKIYVAIDTGFVYRWSGSVYVQIGITAAAGSTTQVQFNDGGAFGGDSGLTFDKTTDALSAGGFIPTSSTVPANGVYLPAANSVAVSTGGTARLYVGSTGLVGIGTTSPSAPLHVKSTNPQVIVDSPDASTESRVRWYKNGSSVGSIASDSGNLRVTSESAITFTINGGAGGLTESARLDSSGRLLVGTSTTSSENCTLQVRNNTGTSAEFFASSADEVGPYVLLTKSRGTEASPAEVSNGDGLGTFAFLGYDGSTYRTAARIAAECDGTWTDGGDTTDNPGRLVFSTTADGAASPTERLRITSAGVLQIAEAGNITVGTTTGTKIGTATTQKIGFYNATPVVQPTAVADATDAASGLARLNDLLARLRTLGIIAT